MRKLVYAIGAICLAGGLWSCEDTPENPGDFNLKAELALSSQMVSLTRPDEVYGLTEEARRDTKYR